MPKEPTPTTLCPQHSIFLPFAERSKFVLNVLTQSYRLKDQFAYQESRNLS